MLCLGAVSSVTEFTLTDCVHAWCCAEALMSAERLQHYLLLEEGGGQEKSDKVEVFFVSTRVVAPTSMLNSPF